MAKVKAMAFGYYKDQKIKPGQKFEMKEIDADGHYLDKSGKKVMVEGKDGKQHPKKCGWVSVDLKAVPPSEKDPAAIAKAISGKGAISDVEVEEEEESDKPEAPAKKAK